jgi:hypothetical protein
VLDLLRGVEHRAVVDPHGVRVLILDHSAVHERAHVLQRLVVEIAGADAFRDGLGELRCDLVHVGEPVGHRHRDLPASRPLGDVDTDTVRAAVGISAQQQPSQQSACLEPPGRQIALRAGISVP